MGPLKHGATSLAQTYERVLRSAEMRLEPVTETILRRGALLRAAATALRTPDAIHAATALHLGCAMFLTNDKGFGRVTGLPVTVLDEVIQP